MDFDSNVSMGLKANKLIFGIKNSNHKVHYLLKHTHHLSYAFRRHHFYIKVNFVWYNTNNFSMHQFVFVNTNMTSSFFYLNHGGISTHATYNLHFYFKRKDISTV